MRVGIHSGPVVAGIVGVKKLQYDIWGDTVNTVSRLETSGEVGQVNISEATYLLAKDAIVSSPRSSARTGEQPSTTDNALCSLPEAKCRRRNSVRWRCISWNWLDHFLSQGCTPYSSVRPGNRDRRSWVQGRVASGW